jgi:DNA-nicking Smr family endonuclease
VDRHLSAEERALWRKVMATVRPLAGKSPPSPEAELPADSPRPPMPPTRSTPSARVSVRKARPGTTLDASWDRRLARGLVTPDATVDLHGHGLASAHEMLDRRLEETIAAGDRLVLLITGKPPAEHGRHAVRPAVRGAIRAAVGDWLAASRHAADIAAVRNAHPRHGGAGALYIVLRRRR